MRYACRLVLLVLVSGLLFGSAVCAEPLLIGGQVSAGGEPAAGVKVILLPVIDGHAAGVLRLGGVSEPEPVAEASSDAGGRFELAAPEIGFWKLRLEHDGWVPRELRLEPLLYAVELGELELESDAGIKLRLRAGGEPSAARVSAYPFDPKMSRMFGRRVPAQGPGGWQRPLFTGTGDQQGALRVPASGEEQGWVVEAVADGFVPLLREVSGRSAELVLETGLARRIRTVDARGGRLAGALLFLEEGQLPLAMTGEDGLASLVAPAGEDLELKAIDGEGRHGTLRLAPPAPGEPAQRPVTMVLDEPRQIHGRVVEEGSRDPIPGALVWTGSGAEAVTADASGGYSLWVPGGGSGPWGQRLRAAAAGYVPGLERAPAAGDAGPTIGLRPAAGVRGRVVDAGGESVAGVAIEASPKASGGRRRVFRGPGPQQRQGRSAKDGRFDLPGLAAGQGYELRFVKTGYAPGELDVEELEPFERRSGLEAVLHRGRRAVGLVVDEEELPVAGAVVRLAAPADPRRRFRMPGSEEPAVPEDATGIDGTFAVSDLAAGRYDLEVSSPGFGPVTIPGVEVPEGPAGDGEVDLGTVVLSPGVAIEGQVVDAEGRPLSGVEIRTAESSRVPMPAAFRLMMAADQPPAAISGGDGRFTVRDRRAGERLDLIADAPGYMATTVPGVVAPSEEPVRVVLKQASRVSGRVVDSTGDPIEGAGVRALPEGLGGSGGRRPGNFHRAASDAGGRFELLDVEPGTVTMAAQAEGYQETRLSGLVAPAGGELRDVELVLRPGATVRGVVLDAGGEPVAGAQVRISATGGSGRPEGFTLADGDGRFELAGVGLGRRTVTASSEDGREVSKSLEVEAGTQSVELRLAGGVEVSGRVVDAAGLGVAGAVVSLEPASPTVVWYGASSEAVSSAGGAFTLAGVPAGNYRLQAARKGFARTAGEEPIEVASSPIAGLEIRLDPGTALSGRILGLELDDLAQVEVRAGRTTGEVDFEGAYRIEHVAPGEVTVLAGIPGSGRQITERVTVEPGAGEVVLDLEFGSGYVLTGRVVTGEEPVAGATVRLYGATVSTRGTATTDAEGRFRIEGLKAGGYQLWVRSYDSGVEHQDHLELQADDDVLIQIGTGRVAGQVRESESGDGVEGVTLMLVGADLEGPMRGFGGKSATSDSRGRFSFAAVPAGSWQLRASKAGYADAEIALQTFAGEEVEGLDVLLAATPGLSFEVVSAAGAPASRVLVALLDGAGQRVAGGSYRTLEGGRVEITTVPAGSWEMLIVAGDSAVLSLQVTVPGDAGRIQLSPGGGVAVEVPALADGRVDARPQLLGPGGRPCRGVSYGGTAMVNHTLRAGSAKVTNVPLGPWTAEVKSGERTWSTAVMVVPGEPVAVKLR